MFTDQNYQPIKFPKDEQVHDHIIEWWYFNGHLNDKEGNGYSFMSCLFRADVKKVKIPFLSKMPVETIYFSHAILSDLEKNKSYPSIDTISVVTKDSFTRPLLYVKCVDHFMFPNNINYVIEQTEPFVYLLQDKNVDLKFTATKTPILEGGNGYLDLHHDKKTYYYSLTSLKTEGKIKVEDKWIEVTGKSWMDHQWADVSYPMDKWTWFSIQFENGTDMVCFEYDNHGSKINLVSISYPDGTQEHFNGVEFIPLGMEWTSPKTKTTYPLKWNIKVPAKNIDIKISTLMKEQEMMFGTINYWEGPHKAEGLLDGERMEGVGFMELVGYPSKYSNTNYVTDKFAKMRIDFNLRFKKDALFVTSLFKEKLAAAAVFCRLV